MLEVAYVRWVGCRDWERQIPTILQVEPVGFVADRDDKQIVISSSAVFDIEQRQFNAAIAIPWVAVQEWYLLDFERFTEKVKNG